jgi:hypothetical protein
MAGAGSACPAFPFLLRDFVLFVVQTSLIVESI